ncbi:HEAT repeat domain-containing protein [Candidatus Uabimicrobium sp. HlEnr_7]|uniref:HEAT repeat domain-containing protein n=1 Tax=Candidatus Uabimicrobium helgolandensis TaxID=3095367 RepID=UPI003555F239
MRKVCIFLLSCCLYAQTMDKLLEDLERKDWTQRICAAYELGNKEVNKELVLHLIKLMNDKEIGVQNLATSALIRAANSDESAIVLSLIFDHLRLKKNIKKVLYVLSKTEKKKSLIFLEILRFLEKHPGKTTLALKIGKKEDFAPVLLKTLRKEDVFVKKRIFAILKQYHSGYLPYSEDIDEYLRTTVKILIEEQEFFEELSEKLKVESSIVRRYVFALTKEIEARVVKAEENEVAEAVKKMIIRMTSSKEGKAFIPELKKLLSHEKLEVKNHIIDILRASKENTSDCLLPLAKLLNENEKYENLEKSVVEIALFFPKVFISEKVDICLADKLKSAKQNEFRRRLTKCFSEINIVTPAIINTVINLLDDDDRYMRMLAYKTLYKFGMKAEKSLILAQKYYPHRIDRLLKAIQQKDEIKDPLPIDNRKKNYEVKLKELFLDEIDYSFGHREAQNEVEKLTYSEPYTVNTLVDIVLLDNVFLSASAANTLGKVGGEKVILALLNLLKRPKWSVKRNTIRALGLLQEDHRVVSALVNVIRSEKIGLLRLEAAQALSLPIH